MGHTAAMDHAAIKHAWYKLGSFFLKLWKTSRWFLKSNAVLFSFSCQFYPRGYSCRYAVNDCDISETCSGDSGQVELMVYLALNSFN